MKQTAQPRAPRVDYLPLTRHEAAADVTDLAIVPAMMCGIRTVGSIALQAAYDTNLTVAACASSEVSFDIVANSCCSPATR